MSSAIVPLGSPSYFERLGNWAKQSPQLAMITTLAFAALGIASGIGVASLIASVSLATILGLVSALCLAASGTVAYFLLKQAIASHRSGKVESVDGSPPNIPADDRSAQANYRVQVIHDTLNHLRAGFYTSPDGNRHPLDLNAAAQGATLMLNAGPIFQHPGRAPTRILVKNQDCLYAAAELNAKGLNPIVLDMANDEYVGGGYLGGANAQEEDCFRRSGLPLAIDMRYSLQNRNFYPLHLHSEYAGLYVPRVPVFRAGYDKGYQYLNQPFEVAYGVFAAPCRPTLDYSSGTPRLRPQEEAVVRERTRTFLEMARQKGHRSVVLGAFGCGAFQNPPNHIAEITMEVIQYEFAHCFDEIVIAIVDDHNTRQPHNPEGNFIPFARRAMNAGFQAFDANRQQLTRI